MTKQEALREIWRRWHDTPEAEWRGKLEEWVLDLLCEKATSSQQLESEYERGYEEGVKDAREDLQDVPAVEVPA